jgi:hypothetical protein
VPVWAFLFLLTGANAGFSWGTVLSCALTIAVLVTVIEVTTARGWPLVWLVFLLYFGISWINTLDEAVLFHVMPPGVAFQGLAQGATTTFTMSVLLVLLLKRMNFAGEPPRPVSVDRGGRALVFRVASGALLYFVIYLIAGIAVNPFIKEFYAGKWLPSLGELFGIQFLRGLLYVVIALPFIGQMAGRRMPAGVVLGLCYSVLGGIAPLLLPNVFMPLHIRFAHSIEVGISNFVFGVAIGCLLVKPRTAEKRLEPGGILADS